MSAKKADKSWETPEIWDAYRADIATQLNDLPKGGSSYARIAETVYENLKTRFTVDKLAASMMLPLILDGVHKAADLRAIEKNTEDQAELFGVGFLNALIKIDEQSIMKVRDATRDILREADERKYRNLSTAQTGYKRWRDRLGTLLKDYGMEADPKLTVEQAIASHKPPSKGPAASPDGPQPRAP